jgi:glycosyltransferase involved in cell wall biosynthesis
MKIGLLAPPWLPVPPPKYGGTESVIDRLARGFVAAGHDVTLFTTGDATCPVPRRAVIETSEAHGIGSAVVEQFHVAHAYDELRHCDLVHDHTIVGPMYADRFPDLPVVTTNHGPFSGELLGIYRFMARTVPIIAISHHQASTAQGVPIAAVIHHGIDVEAFEPPSANGHGHAGRATGGDYLLFLGRMVADKGARTAVEVARAAGMPIKLAAKMREEQEVAYFESQVRPLLGPEAEYVGEVGGPDKLALLAGARALVNPIRWPEPFGLVMIEALASGTPVLAFPEGAAPEIVEHGRTGFLCADEDAMVAAIGRLDELDPAACRQAAEDRFSTERMAADHLALFDQILSAWPVPHVALRQVPDPSDRSRRVTRRTRTSPEVEPPLARSG